MPLSDWFERMTDREAQTFSNAVFNYFTGHEKRHAENLERLDLLIGALGAGLRAAGEALERGSRRR